MKITLEVVENKEVGVSDIVVSSDDPIVNTYRLIGVLEMAKAKIIADAKANGLKKGSEFIFGQTAEQSNI